MKKLLLVFMILLFASQYSIGQWTKVTEITENQVFKAINFNGDLLVGTRYVYKSTNLGQSFSLFCNTSILVINALSIVNGDVWVGNGYQNSYTTNNGLNWINANLNKYTYDFCSYNSNWIFAGTESFKCYFTNNGGANWGQCTNIWEDVNCFEPVPGKLLAGTSLGLYYTTENSIDWTITSVPQINVTDIIKKDSLIFTATSWGVWKSTDNAATWDSTSLRTSVLSLDRYNQFIFAGTFTNGFYITSNNGLTWIPKNEGLGNVRINCIAIVSNTVFAGTENYGLWKRPLNEIVGITKIESNIPGSYILSQNYPNPFNPSTNIRYSILSSVKGEMSNVKLIVFDILGKEIETLVSEKQSPGTYEVTFDGSDYPSGVYFYKLSTGDYSETKKMILMK